MPHALAEFIRTEADARGWRNRDLAAESGLSRQMTSKYLSDQRDSIARLPEAETLRGFAKAFGVPLDFLLAKAIESLGLGYVSGDFVNEVHTASDAELIAEVGRRLATLRTMIDPAAGSGGHLRAVTDEMLSTPERVEAYLREDDAEPAAANLTDAGQQDPGDEDDPDPT